MEARESRQYRRPRLWQALETVSSVLRFSQEGCTYSMYQVSSPAGPQVLDLGRSTPTASSRSAVETASTPSGPEVFEIALPQLVDTSTSHDTVDHPLHFLLLSAADISGALPSREIDSPGAYDTHIGTNLERHTQVLDADKIRE